MTTVVASVSLGGIAADTRVTGDNSYYPARKVFRIDHPKGESILGTAGHGFMCLAFLEWFKTPKRDPKVLHEIIGKEYDRDGIAVLELNSTGLYAWNGWGYGEQILRDSHAIGSGGQAALEALRCGRSLEDAVTRAFDHDEFSGCEVQVEYLLPPELKSRRRGKA